MTKLYIDNMKDLLEFADKNVYGTEYSDKITISVKKEVYSLFKIMKKQFAEHGIHLNNAQLFEVMVVEMFNTNKDSYV